MISSSLDLKYEFEVAYLNSDGLSPVTPAKYVFDTDPNFPTGYNATVA